MQATSAVIQNGSSLYLVLVSTIGALAALLGAAFAGYSVWTRHPHIEISGFYNWRSPDSPLPYGIGLSVIHVRGHPLEISEAGLVLSSGKRWRYEPWKPGTSLGVSGDFLPRQLAEGRRIEQMIPLEKLRFWIKQGHAPPELLQSSPEALWVTDSRHKTWIARLDPVSDDSWQEWIGVPNKGV